MIKEKFQSLITNQGEKNSKKKIENIVAFIIILIVTVIAINTIWSGQKRNEETENAKQDTTKQLAVVKQTATSTETEDTMEEQLENILSNIDGVGKVKVLITYSQSSEVVAMYNENSKSSLVEEKDSGRWNKNNNRNRYGEGCSI